MIKCPVCGSEKLETRSEPVVYEFPYAEPVAVQQPVHTCYDCKYEGDFGNTYDANFCSAELTARKQSLRSILKWLHEIGLDTTHLAMVCLGLPGETALRWKEGNCSRSEILLLRLIRTQPELIEVFRNHLRCKVTYAS